MISHKNEFLGTIRNIADIFLTKEQQITKDRSFMPSGHNGPYFDLETPVRNTAHWLVNYSKLYQQTREKKYFYIANRLANYLMDPGDWLKDGVYIHRQKPGKDWCNGVIGQAWVIEALNIASECLNRTELMTSALNAAKVFPYNKSVGAWEKIDPYNGKKNIDYTLNHQTWFAAAVFELNDESLNQNVAHYLDGLKGGAMRVRRDGLIAHLLYKNSLKGLALQLRYRLTEKRIWKKIREKEVGYHLFNLHPLARIYRCAANHPLFSSIMFQKSIDIAYEDSFLDELSHSQYAYPYNSPAFEFPLVSESFNKTCPDHVFNLQLEKTKSDELNHLGICPDINTLNARIYEFLIR